MGEAVKYRDLPDGALFWWAGDLYQKLGSEYALRPDTATRYRFFPDEKVRRLAAAEQPQTVSLRG